MSQEREERHGAEARPTQVSWASVAIVPGVIFAVTFIILAWVLVPKVLAERRNARILREGVAARALVTSIVPTGSHHNEDPEVVISLQVTPAEGKPFSSTVEMALSPVHLPRFQPGLTVNVRFDPKNPGDVALVVP